MIDHDKYYKYARSIAGSLGNDLYHHVLIKIQGKEVKHMDSYIYRSMLNEFHDKKSSFSKLYNPIVVDKIDDIESKSYDVLILYSILLSLENEGFTLEVAVFKDCYFGSSVQKVVNKTKLSKRTIVKICTFVKSEIVKRYGTMDN